MRRLSIKPLLLALSLLFGSTFLQAQSPGNYRNLVMEGGGMKGIAYGGALVELQKRGVLDSVQRVAGTSAGAIQATLVAIGYSAEEISAIIAQTPFNKFNDGSVWGATRRFRRTFGWFKGNTFRRNLEDVIKQRVGNPNLTFAQLHELTTSGRGNYKDLYVTGTNLSAQRLEVFSHETYPHMRIADAVRISMSIPLYFEAVWLNREGRIIEKPTEADSCHLFVDGGLLLNYPVGIFDHTRYVKNYEGQPGKVFNQETLGLQLARCEQIEYDLRGKPRREVFPIRNLQTYVSAVSTALMRNSALAHPDDHRRTIYIDDSGMNPRVRKVSHDEKNAMMVSGRLGVIDFFNRGG